MLLDTTENQAENVTLPESSSFCLSSKTEIDETGFGYTLSLLSGRYKMIILYWLSEYKAVMRFNELHR